MRYMAGVRMWDASYRKCVPGGSTPSATGGLSDVASGVWYAPAHTYNSAPGKVILDQSVEALPVRCSGIRDRPAATCKCCDRRSVATAEDVLSHFIHRGKLRFPQLGVWLSFTLWSIYGICSPCYDYIAIIVSQEMHHVNIYWSY